MRIKKIGRYLFLNAVVTFWISAALAQSDIIRLEVELTKPLGDKWEIAGTATWRESVAEYEWSRQTLELSAIYNLKSFSFMGSFATYYTEDEGTPILELRPWQGIALDYPDWDRVELVNSLRFEQRFQRENQVRSFSPRIRYEISTRIALNKTKLEENTLYLYAAAELLNSFNQPLEERFSDTRTLASGLGFIFSENSSLELSYEADVTNNTLEADAVESDVRTIRLRWMYSL